MLDAIELSRCCDKTINASNMALLVTKEPQCFSLHEQLSRKDGRGCKNRNETLPGSAASTRASIEHELVSRLLVGRVNAVN